MSELIYYVNPKLNSTIDTIFDSREVITCELLIANKKTER